MYDNNDVCVFFSSGLGIGFDNSRVEILESAGNVIESVSVNRSLEVGESVSLNVTAMSDGKQDEEMILYILCWYIVYLLWIDT